jgi:hypothetical protein
MASPYPLALDAVVTLKGRKLLFQIHYAVFTITLGEPAAEWIWVDVLGGGDVRAERQIMEAAVTLTEKGVQIAIGAGPTKYPLFHSLQPHARGILLDRQQAAKAGEKGLWNVVAL